MGLMWKLLMVSLIVLICFLDVMSLHLVFSLTFSYSLVKLANFFTPSLEPWGTRTRKADVEIDDFLNNINDFG